MANGPNRRLLLFRQYKDLIHASRRTVQNFFISNRQIAKKNNWYDIWGKKIWRWLERTENIVFCNSPGYELGFLSRMMERFISVRRERMATWIILFKIAERQIPGADSLGEQLILRIPNRILCCTRWKLIFFIRGRPMQQAEPCQCRLYKEWSVYQFS